MKTTTSPTYTVLLGAAILFGLSNPNHKVHSQSPLKANTDSSKPTATPAALESNTPASAAPPTVALQENKPTQPSDILSELADVPTLQTNDPFANTFAMLQRATAENPITSTLNARSGSSDLQLRGTVVDANEQALALVEVGRTGVHVVRVGDTLSLSGGGRSANVTILAIHRQSIEVEYGNFEDSIIIR